jgi:hypothetical protein
MRNLNNDLEWLVKCQNNTDLSDSYLQEHGQTTRKDYDNRTCDFEYGITFVESSIAREWLERAIKAENILSNANN